MCTQESSKASRLFFSEGKDAQKEKIFHLMNSSIIRGSTTSHLNKYVNTVLLDYEEIRPRSGLFLFESFQSQPNDTNCIQ